METLQMLLEDRQGPIHNSHVPAHVRESMSSRHWRILLNGPKTKLYDTLPHMLTKEAQGREGG